MRTLRCLAPLLLLGTLLAGGAAPAAGQSQYELPPDERGPYERHPEAVKAIDRLKSPFCPGFMLEVCSSGGGAALRDTVEMLADSGMVADSIVEWVIARYGEEWRALPPAEGRGLIAWIVPPLAVVLGIATVVVVLRRIRRPRDGPPPDEISDAERRRLDEAIREIEAEEETPF